MNILLASLSFKPHVGGIENLFFFMSEQFRFQALAIELCYIFYNIDENNLLTIQDTESQSETLLCGIKNFSNILGPIIVHNIDTILYERDYYLIQNDH